MRIVSPHGLPVGLSDHTRCPGACLPSDPPGASLLRSLQRGDPGGMLGQEDWWKDRLGSTIRPSVRSNLMRGAWLESRSIAAWYSIEESRPGRPCQPDWRSASLPGS